LESLPDAAIGRRTAFLLCCVGLPLAALGFELATHGSLLVLFDPIPSWLHVLAVASVPACVLAADVAFWRGAPSRRALAAAGVAAGIAFPYTLLFLPVLPFAAIGVLWFGLGLLAFAPLAGLLGALHRGRALARRVENGGRVFWGAAMAGFAFLALIELPGWITWHALEREAVPQLARFSTRNQLLRAAWLGADALNLTTHLARGGPLDFFEGRNAHDRERNQRLFHRVTGEDAAASPPRLPGARDPQFLETGWGRSGLRADRLSLASSRLDVSAFADPGLAYFEWTLVFQNDRPFDQEATALLLLPPGGVVTRANLWIDGQEREAAFGGRSQVREAYEAVVSTRRDPLLVTSDRPGEASIRAFPVPGNGSMRVRVGVTAPLELASPERAELQLPGFGTRNFALPDALAHDVWIDSRTPILAGAAGLAPKTGDGVHTAQGALPAGGDAARVAFARAADAEPFVASDGSEDLARPLIRQRALPAQPQSTRWVVVVDGSSSMARHRERLVAALEALPAERLAGIAVAEDAPVWLFGAEQPDRVAAFERLREYEFAGGDDAAPALEAAWDVAHAAGDAGVLWLAGFQPLLIRHPGALSQRIERRPEVEIAAVALDPRGHALLNELPARANLTVVRAPAANAALAALAADGRTGWRFARERVADAGGARVWNGSDPVAHALRRLWASDEVMRRLRHDGSAATRSAAAELAARYRVVTPVSGAVVLERDEQYRAAGLPVPGSDEGNPLGAVVPEPGTGLLLGFGLALLAAKRRRAPAQRAPRSASTRA
jgi:hypothetical protein